MSTRGFTLYQLTALARLQHSQGHSGIGCTVPDDLDKHLGTHDSHPEFYRWSAEYSALVALPVIESPVCQVCGAVRPVVMAIPGRVMGGTWVPGSAITQCGECGHRIAYRPSALGDSIALGDARKSAGI